MSDEIKEMLANADEEEQGIIINEVLKALNADKTQSVTIYIGDDGEYYEYTNVKGSVISDILDLLSEREDEED